MMLPGGLASEASFEDTKYCVQTEFAQRPNPRITTTIWINGEVLDKVENAWDRLPQTEEDRKEIEMVLKRQHQEVLENIKERREKRLSPGLQNNQVTRSEKNLRPEVTEKLSKSDGVFGWVFVSEEESDRADQSSRPQEKNSQDMVCSVKSFCSLLSSVTRLGNFVGGILEVPRSCTAFMPLQNQFLGIQLDPKVDFKELIEKIKSIA
ncbi:MAG: hypothetical protein GTO24_26475 [candidate division Zixibacteria bacterium]|nr:hypothetical protein [candidate division Zixibacteria bacterium]